MNENNTWEYSQYDLMMCSTNYPMAVSYEQYSSYGTTMILAILSFSTANCSNAHADPKSDPSFLSTPVAPLLASHTFVVLAYLDRHA